MGSDTAVVARRAFTSWRQITHAGEVSACVADRIRLTVPGHVAADFVLTYFYGSFLKQQHNMFSLSVPWQNDL